MTSTKRAMGLALFLFFAWSAGSVRAAELNVMSSGGLTAAFQTLIPSFEAKTGHKVRLTLGASMGTAPDAIPVRLGRGEPADVFLIVGYALDDLVAKGFARAGTRVDLAESKIAAAVREGATRPDIASVDAFKRALLDAKTIAYSSSASGVYIEREMYKKLGLEAELAPKSRKIVSERVGAVVARGEAELGFQQMSELVPIKGIAILGPIPAEVQSVTMFSAGLATNAQSVTAAEELLAFLRSPEAAAVMRDTGLDPIVNKS